jgi:hypothetical protein
MKIIRIAEFFVSTAAIVLFFASWGCSVDKKPDNNSIGGESGAATSSARGGDGGGAATSGGRGGGGVSTGGKGSISAGGTGKTAAGGKKEGGSGGAGTSTGGKSATGGAGGTGKAGAGSEGEGGRSSGGTGSAKIMFLHHSTGEVVWEGGVASWFDSYNSKNATLYEISQVLYPDSPYPWQNYPYDYWHLWADGKASEEQVPTIESLTSEYDVVIFKHCFPVSGIEADTGQADIESSTMTIENYKVQYNALKTKLNSFSNNKFIVWTGAALLQSESDAEQGKRAREFFTWVKNSWDKKGDNIFVWDFFELETEGGNFLLDKYSSGDSHPSSSFGATVAPYLGQRIVDVIEGRGDTGNITGHN